jgi:DNA-binding protein H-NS
MANLIEIQNQLASLNRQASDIKSKEFNSTVQDIVAKMQAFGFTVKHLQSTRPVKSRKGVRRNYASDATARRTTGASKKAETVVQAKYRGPQDEMWSGRGLTTKWLATLVAQGQAKDFFFIAQ